MCARTCGVFYFYVIFKPAMYKTHEQSSVSDGTPEDRDRDDNPGCFCLDIRGNSLFLVQVESPLTILECE